MSIPVLLLAHELNFGGLERDVSKFARHLHRYGVEPHVAAFRQGGARWDEIEQSGIPVFHLPVTSLKSRSVLTAAAALRRYAKAHDIAVLHAFDPATEIFGVPFGRLAGIPVTLSSQLCFRELVPFESWRKMLTVIDRIATGLFVNCHALEEHLAVDWKVARSRIHVCHNGVETEEFHPDSRSRPPALADASVVIGTVAVLRPEKELHLLVSAFAEVQKTDPRCKLLIVGEGPLKEGLVRQAAELGVGGSCVFQDATRTPAASMRAIDIFVSSSRSEAFSNALLEAMACGCCPVGSRVGGTPELISDGERGFLFEKGNAGDLADKLSRLVRDPGLRQRMSDNSLAFVREHLTIEVAASRLAGIYKSLLKQQGHATVLVEAAGS